MPNLFDQNGKPLNPGGKSQGERKQARDFKIEFWKAMKEVEGLERKTLMKHTVEQAFKNPDILKAVLNKMLPDLSKDEGIENMVRTFLIRSSENK